MIHCLAAEHKSTLNETSAFHKDMQNSCAVVLRPRLVLIWVNALEACCTRKACFVSVLSDNVQTDSLSCQSNMRTDTAKHHGYGNAKFMPYRRQ